MMRRLRVAGARLFAPRIRPAGPPALIVGTARSGTSFTGATLGAAQNAAYLREPVTFDVFRDHADLVPALARRDPDPRLERLVDRAFSGRAHPARTVTLWPEQFRSSADTLVVKEVLPLSAGWMARRTGARVLFIHRHPGAVIASWWRREWFGSPIEEQLADTLRDRKVMDHRAARLAAIFAIQEEAMLTAAADLGGLASTVRYEDVALEPVATFRAASEHLGLVWTAEREEEIRSATDGTLRRDDGRSADLVRRATDRVAAWQTELDADERRAAAQGYEALGGSMYRAEW